MKTKKSQAGGIVFGIIALVLFIIAVGVVLMMINQNKSEKAVEQPINYINIFVKAVDSDTKNQISTNYFIDYNNNVTVSEGTLQSDAWTELMVPSNELLHLYCWSDKYYVIKGNLANPVNKSQTICDPQKIGNLTITHDGDLSKETNNIKLNISTENWFSKTSMCFAWTSGIIDVSVQNQVITCETGLWKNYTIFNESKKDYDYLPQGQYLCGEDYIENCESTSGNRCKTKSEEIPQRFSGKVDSCTYIGKTLHNETFQIDLEVRTTEYKNAFDEIKIYIYDKDRRPNTIEQRWTWFSEFEKENVGLPYDITHTIKFQE